MTYLLWILSLNNVEAPRVRSMYTVCFIDALFERYWGKQLYYLNMVQNRSYYYGEGMGV